MILTVIGSIIGLVGAKMGLTALSLKLFGANSAIYLFFANSGATLGYVIAYIRLALGI